jgi:hypothetical protein
VDTTSAYLQTSSGEDFRIVADSTIALTAATDGAVDLAASKLKIGGSYGTDGHVLTSTGSGVAWEAAAGGGSGAALTGSTDNTICTVTGADAIQGEASLTFDGTDLKNTAGRAMGLGGALAAPTFGFTNDAVGLGMSSPTSSELNFVTDSTERVRIDATGNVGIGTVAPARKLDVAGNIRVGGSNRLEFGGSSDYVVGGSSTLQFATNGVVAQTIDSGGKVGINSAAPTAKLFIQGASTERAFQAVGLGTTIGTGYFYTNAIHTGTGTNATLSVRSDHTSATGDVLHVQGDGTGNLLTLDQGGTDRLIVKSGGQVYGGVTALSEVADVEIDFNGTNLQTLVVTGTCTELSTTGLAAGRTVEVRLTNSAGDWSAFTPTTPAWKLIGTSLTGTGVTDGEYGILKLTSWGTTDADVTAELQVTAV